MERRLWSERFCLIFFMIFSISGRSAAKEAFACLNTINTNLRNATLTCEGDRVIEIQAISAARDALSKCEPDPPSGCDYQQVNTTEDYYISLNSNCSGHVSCHLSSTVLWSDYRFSSCGGVTATLRSMVEVNYRCIDKSDSTAATGPGATSSSTQDGATSNNQGTISSGPNTTPGGSPDDTTSISTDGSDASAAAEEEQKDTKDDMLAVKIAAPILGVLFVAALIALVLILRRRTNKPPGAEVNVNSRTDLEQTNTYEDVTGPFGDEEDAYYSEPREDNLQHFTNAVDRDETSSFKSEIEGINGMGRPVTGNQKRMKPNGSVADEDDGFYDTASDENEYDLAEPIVSDDYAKINKKPTDGTPGFVIQDDRSEASPRGNRRDRRTATNDLYVDTTNGGAVLITNDLYELTELREEGEQVEDPVQILIENDLYDSN